jgi:multidrug efflux pump subunit AcrB
MVDLSPALLQSKGLSATDVTNTLALQDLVLPSGTVKIDQFEYDVDMNARPTEVDKLNDLPIKVVGNSTMYLRDVPRPRWFRSANEHRAAGRPARCPGYRAEGRERFHAGRRIGD